MQKAIYYYMLLLILLFIPFLTHAQPIVNRSFDLEGKKIHTWEKPVVSKNSQGQSIPYKIISVRISEDKENIKSPIPVILYLHGAGQRGNDNEKQTTGGLPKLVESLISLHHSEFDIIAPQCPIDMKWVDTDWSAASHEMQDSILWTLELAKTALDQHLTLEHIDPTRVYLIGLSMGGFGVWELLQRYPNFFAAAIPICGGGDPAYAMNIATTPIWAVHGRADKVVLPDRSEEMVIATQLAGGYAQLDLLAEHGHDVWSYTFTNKAILKWLWQQQRRP